MTDGDATGTADDDTTSTESDVLKTDGGSRSERWRAVLTGETGFERATVWSAVGLALTVAAFVAVDPVDLFTLGRAVAVVAVSLTTLGTAGLARVGGGVGPCVVLAGGPVAGAVVGAIRPDAFGAALGPEPVTASLVVAVGQSLAVAALVAVVVGVIGYVVGRASRSSSRITPTDDSDGASGGE